MGGQSATGIDRHRLVFLMGILTVSLSSSFEDSTSEFEADFIWTDSAEQDPASSLSLPGLAMDSLLEGTGTGLP